MKEYQLLMLLQKYTGYNISGKNERSEDQSVKYINHSIEIDDSMGEGKLIDAIFGNKCEKNFIKIHL